MASGWLGWDWGNVPSWVGALLTGSSLLIAARTYWRSVAERAREQDDRERRYASNVSAWSSTGRQVTVKNSNEVAITVRVFYPDPPGPAASGPVVLPPGGTRIVALPAAFERAAPDGPVPALLIVDPAGLIWRRGPDGGLDKVAPQAREAVIRELDQAPTKLELRAPGS